MGLYRQIRLDCYVSLLHIQTYRFLMLHTSPVRWSCNYKSIKCDAVSVYGILILNSTDGAVRLSRLS